MNQDVTSATSHPTTPILLTPDAFMGLSKNVSTVEILVSLGAVHKVRLHKITKI